MYFNSDKSQTIKEESEDIKGICILILTWLLPSKRITRTMLYHGYGVNIIVFVRCIIVIYNEKPMKQNVMFIIFIKRYINVAIQ